MSSLVDGTCVTISSAGAGAGERTRRDSAGFTHEVVTQEMLDAERQAEAKQIQDEAKRIEEMQGDLIVMVQEEGALTRSSRSDSLVVETGGEEKSEVPVVPKINIIDLVDDDMIHIHNFKEVRLFEDAARGLRAQEYAELIKKMDVIKTVVSDYGQQIEGLKDKYTEFLQFSKLNIFVEELNRAVPFKENGSEGSQDYLFDLNGLKDNFIAFIAALESVNHNLPNGTLSYLGSISKPVAKLKADIGNRSLQLQALKEECTRLEAKLSENVLGPEEETEAVPNFSEQIPMLQHISPDEMFSSWKANVDMEDQTSVIGHYQKQIEFQGLYSQMYAAYKSVVDKQMLHCLGPILRRLYVFLCVPELERKETFFESLEFITQRVKVLKAAGVFEEGQLIDKLDVNVHRGNLGMDPNVVKCQVVAAKLEEEIAFYATKKATLEGALEEQTQAEARAEEEQRLEAVLKTAADNILRPVVEPVEADIRAQAKACDVPIGEDDGAVLVYAQANHENADLDQRLRELCERRYHLARVAEEAVAYFKHSDDAHTVDAWKTDIENNRSITGPITAKNTFNIGWYGRLKKWIADKLIGLGWKTTHTSDNVATAFAGEHQDLDAAIESVRAPVAVGGG